MTHTNTECDHVHAPAGVLKKRRKAERGTHKPMRFTSLHHHSTYSSLDGFQLPEAHVRRVSELNMSALAMTEHGNISSHDGLERAAKKFGIKPIYGCEVYTGRVGEGATQRKYHLTVLARDLDGYRNLLRLVSAAWSDGFHYEPTVSWDMLKRYGEGLTILSGCQGSLLFCSAVGGKLIDTDDASYKRAREVARIFQRQFGPNYFIEVQAFPDLELTRQFNPIAERLSRDLDIGLVATMDCHYTVPKEREIQMLLHNLRPGNQQTLEEQVRSWGYTEHLCPPPNDLSIYRRLRLTGLSKLAAQEAIVNTETIAGGVERFDLPSLPTLRFPVPDGFGSTNDVWRHEIRAGWRARGVHLLPAAERQRYKERLQREISIVEAKDFQDYFLMVGDMVRWAKDQDIPVGPARGSAAASLICYLLRITEVNPMVFDMLVFERFIDISREDLPDIDLDFDSDRRHEVREYLVAKYGEGCVNNIGTFTYFKSKNSIDDVARVHKIPKWETDVVKGFLIERSGGDDRATETIKDTVDKFEEAKEVFDKHPELYKSCSLEGNIKNIGVHAAGLVVSNGPITDVCAVYERKVQGVLTKVVSLGKHDAERRGLVKIDVLGLSTMAMIAEAMRHLDMKVADLYDLPLDDEVVIDGFRRNDTVGIFQFDGRATRNLCEAIRPDSFLEICDINALSRPGPLYSGAASAYTDIKRGRLQPERIHPAFDAVTKDFKGQIIYQEQILRVVREIGNFDWSEASHIRKVIGLKLGDAEFNSHFDRFWQGAQELHSDMNRDCARRIWFTLASAGSYAFNLAHTVSYGMLAYWTQWIKQYHTEVFYASALSKLADAKSDAILRDASRVNGERRRVKALPPDPHKSKKTWLPMKGDGEILAGYSQIPGIGSKTADSIIEYAAQQPIDDWADLANIRGVGPKTIDKIKEFAGGEDPFGVHRFDNAVGQAVAAITQHNDSAADKIPLPTHGSEDIPIDRGSDIEVVWVGFVTKKMFRDIFEYSRSKGEELDPGQISNPELRESAKLFAEDGDGSVTINFSRFVYPKYRGLVANLRADKDLILVQGTKPGFMNGRYINVTRAWALETEEGDL